MTLLQAYFDKKKFGYYILIFCQFYTPFNMEENKVYIRHFFYWIGRNATKTANKICAVFGEE